MKLTIFLSRLILSLTFIFSGFLKGIDPIGATYKLEEYLRAFGLTWFESWAMPIAILLAAIEFTLGGMLLLRSFPRFTIKVVTTFMIFFTALTLVIAIKNPVADCGCFGEAFKLSNWETFGKNIVLLLAALMLYRNRRGFRPLYHNFFQLTTAIALFIIIIGFQWYNYKHLPIVDFRPYSIGSQLGASTAVIPSTNEEFVLIYKNKNTGEEKEFNENNIPWQDSLTWEFVDSETRFITPEIQENSQAFFVSHPEMGDIGSLIAYDPNNTFLVTLRQLDQIDTTSIREIRELQSFAKRNGFEFYTLTSASLEELMEFQQEHGMFSKFGLMDDTELKTMIRANPGVLLVRDGVIIGKWSANDADQIFELQQPSLLAHQMYIKQQQIEQMRIICALGLLLFVFVIYLCAIKQNNKRYRF